MLVSIIVPIYNAECSLEQCIQSLIRQSYSDFELILVNDGSKDESEEICMRYQRIDQRILYVKKENGGVSSARNQGLSLAKGEYVTFVDSDDYVEDGFLENLMNYSDRDLVLSGFNSSEGISFVPDEIEVDNENRSVAIPSFVSDPYILYTPWAKLFKKQIIIDANIHFDESLRLYEDTIFVLTYLTHCKKVCSIPYAGYKYIGTWGGGTSKYRLSQKEIEYRCKVEYEALSNIEKVFDCHIDKKSRCFAINYFDDLYNKCTDKYCLELYEQYHTESETKEFLNNQYYFPTYEAIYKLKSNCEMRSFIDVKKLLEDLHHFFTIPVNNLNFKKVDEKCLYKLVKNGQLRTAYWFLRMESFIKKIINHGKK